ncbi:nonstructural protein [Blackfly microvirus SF02]|uniref:Nonstructural protein n=1 Tax=Blackfly microvirus SF02 TaxID=2576452 RepID=A0A4P8PKT0_9VIRU|nr:nonstructural protein [Blackfly microvirus SF02]
MEKFIYGIIDNTANDLVGILWLINRDEAAIRQFAEIAADDKNQVGRYPKDHDLWCFGSFNAEAQKITLTGAYIVLTGEKLVETRIEQNLQLGL